MPKLMTEESIIKKYMKKKKKNVAEPPPQAKPNNDEGLKEEKITEIATTGQENDEFNDVVHVRKSKNNYEPTPDEILSDSDYKKALKTINPKMLKFIENYLETMNITKSYQKAYNQKNANCAASNAVRLLSKVNIQQIISYKLKKQAEKKGYTREDRIVSITALRDAAIKDKQYFAASKCEELLSKIMGDLDKKQAFSGESLVIVKSYVVPSFKNVSSAPAQNKEDIKLLIEEYLRARA